MIAVGEALMRGTKAIQAQQVSQTPLLDASLLLCKTTGLSREQLYVKSEVMLSDEAESIYVSLIQQRCAAQPVAYILGEREFFGRTFSLTQDVLIPRPDTEILVEKALELLDGTHAPCILDLCTGSGCIGITLAVEIEDAEVTLTDISEKALQVARKNAETLLSRPLTLIQSDLFEALSGQRYALIATNPPYLTDSWYDDTELQVKQEPKLALVGGDTDGLQIIRRIINEAPQYLRPGGTLLIECDYRQQEAVSELLRIQGFSRIGSKRDLAQLHRIVWGVFDV